MKNSASREEKNKCMLSISEEKIINYLTKIDQERTITLNLMKSHFSSPLMSNVAFASTCEYFGILQHMEDLFDDIIQFNEYDDEAGEYYIVEQQELGLLLFLQSVMSMKENLLFNNISLEMH